MEERKTIIEIEKIEIELMRSTNSSVYDFISDLVEFDRKCLYKEFDSYGEKQEEASELVYRVSHIARELDDVFSDCCYDNSTEVFDGNLLEAAQRTKQSIEIGTTLHGNGAKFYNISCEYAFEHETDENGDCIDCIDCVAPGVEDFEKYLFKMINCNL